MSKPKLNKTDNKLQTENIMLFIFPVILTLVLFVISAIVSVYADLQKNRSSYMGVVFDWKLLDK